MQPRFWGYFLPAPPPIRWPGAHVGNTEAKVVRTLENHAGKIHQPSRAKVCKFGPVLGAAAFFFAAALPFETRAAASSGQESSALSAQAHHYNVVFVMDTSGSMADTDPHSYRLEALHLFTGLLSNSGNTVGAVVFNSTTVMESRMAKITGDADKQALLSSMESSAPHGGTDIGGALQSAVRLLDQRDKELDSIILLLSDGNTDLSTAAATQKSLATEAAAVAESKDKGYKIDSVCLNANNSANPAELSGLSNKTGGVFQEVKDANDLVSVFNQFYDLIYKTAKTSLLSGTVGPDNAVRVPFTVPAFGVEEVNIIILSSQGITDAALTDPSGVQLSGGTLDAMTSVSRTFRIIKVAKPKSGSWVFTAKGTSGDAIQVSMVTNTNYSDVALAARTENGAAGGFAVKKSIAVVGTLTDGGVAVTDSSVYGRYSAILHVTAPGGAASDYPMAAGANGYRAAFTPSKGGTYHATVTVSGNDLSKTSAALTLKVRRAGIDWLPVGMAAGALAVLALAAWLLLRLRRRKLYFYGSVTVEPFGKGAGDSPHAETLYPSRGKCLLYEFQMPVPGFDIHKSCFMPSGKKTHIFFFADRPAYYETPLGVRHGRKVRLAAGVELRLCADSSLEEGFTATFTPEEEEF